MIRYLNQMVIAGYAVGVLCAGTWLFENWAVAGYWAELRNQLRRLEQAPPTEGEAPFAAIEGRPFGGLDPRIHWAERIKQVAAVIGMVALAGVVAAHFFQKSLVLLIVISRGVPQVQKGKATKQFIDRVGMLVQECGLAEAALWARRVGSTGAAGVFPQRPSSPSAAAEEPGALRRRQLGRGEAALRSRPGRGATKDARRPPPGVFSWGRVGADSEGIQPGLHVGRPRFLSRLVNRCSVQLQNAAGKRTYRGWRQKIRSRPAWAAGIAQFHRATAPGAWASRRRTCSASSAAGTAVEVGLQVRRWPGRAGRPAAGSLPGRAAGVGRSGRSWRSRSMTRTARTKSPCCR